MKTSAIVLVLLSPLFVSAQFFSGSYTSQPSIGAVDKVVVDHPSELDGKFASILSFQMIDKDQITLDQSIQPVTGKDAKKIIKKYGSNLEVLSVHELNADMNGSAWTGYLLGYLDEGANGNFLMVREIKDNEKSAKVLDVQLYDLEKVDRYAPRSAYTTGDQ